LCPVALLPLGPDTLFPYRKSKAWLHPTAKARAHRKTFARSLSTCALA